MMNFLKSLVWKLVSDKVEQTISRRQIEFYAWLKECSLIAGDVDPKDFLNKLITPEPPRIITYSELETKYREWLKDCPHQTLGS